MYDSSRFLICFRRLLVAAVIRYKLRRVFSVNVRKSFLRGIVLRNFGRSGEFIPPRHCVTNTKDDGKNEGTRHNCDKL